MKNLILIASELLSIAQQNPNGFTVSKSLEPIKKGFSVACIETQNSFDFQGAKKVVNFAKKNKKVSGFGGWLDKETGKFYFDAIMIITDRSEAIRIGMQNKQIAIYDLEKNEEIKLIYTV